MKYAIYYHFINEKACILHASKNWKTHTHTHTHTSEHNETAPWSLNLQKTCIHHVMKTEIIGQGGRGRWNRVTNEVTQASISWLIICGPRPRQRAWQTRFGATENQIRGGHEKQDSGRSLKTRFGEGMENNIPGGHGKPDSRFGRLWKTRFGSEGRENLIRGGWSCTIGK